MPLYSSLPSSPSFTLVPGLPPSPEGGHYVTSLAVGVSHALAATAGGGLYLWGTPPSASCPGPGAPFLEPPPPHPPPPPRR